MSSTAKTRTPADKKDYDNHLAELLSQCAQGHENAFEELYNTCSSRLYSVALRILKTEGVAEEALQDAFIKIWQRADTYIPGCGPPMAWMYSIVRHQALDLLRRRATRENREYSDGNQLIDTVPDEAKSVLSSTEDADTLMQCLERLPEATRHCIVSAYCEGYSHHELSSHHNSPTNTIKSWIRRGLISLRACIDEHS
ncbi:MAG: RNA polymerase sigma factor [Granulosicoccus sp.]